MTQNKVECSNLVELKTLFLNLDDTGQNGALTILRALTFAQATMSNSIAKSDDLPA